MNIKYFNSKNQLDKRIHQYSDKYDKIFFVTQKAILEKSLLVKKIVQKNNTYICANNENCKSIEEYEKFIQYLYQNKCNRNSVIIAVGGGTVTDFCGFVASSYMRGVPYITIPTTLLGMVDAAVGGKTALNFQGIRNLIGSYKNPDEIIIYNQFILSLEKSEIINGYAEIIKYALIMDKSLFIKIEKNIDTLFSDISPKFIMPIIKRCINHKLRIVKLDNHDQGVRNILNFGHTVGHALESYFNFQISHGVSILYGMQIASYLSYKGNHLREQDYNRIVSLIKKIGLKKLIKLDSKKVSEFITIDKKNINNKLNYILLKKIGSAYIEKNYNKESIKEALKIL